MSETTSPSPSKDHSVVAPPERKGSGALRVVLLVILLVMFGLLGLDIYARRASNAAFKRVEALVMKEELASPEEIHELLGRAPDAPIEQVEHYYIETYSWQRGNLLKKEFVKVIYAVQEGEPVLDEVVRNVAPDMLDIPAPPPLDPEKVDPTDGTTPNGGTSADGGEEENTADANEPDSNGPGASEADSSEPDAIE